MEALEEIIQGSPLEVEYKWGYNNVFRGASSVASCETPLSYLSALSSFSNKKRKVILQEQEHEAILSFWKEEKIREGEEKSRVSVEVVNLEDGFEFEKQQQQPHQLFPKQDQEQHQHQPQTLHEHLVAFRKEEEGTNIEEPNDAFLSVLSKTEKGEGEQPLGMSYIEERVRRECLQWANLPSLLGLETQEEDDEETTEEEEKEEGEEQENQEEKEEQDITIAPLPFGVGLIAVIMCKKYAFFIRNPYKISLGMHKFLTQERERKGILPSSLALSPSSPPSSQDGQEWSRCLWFSYQILMSFSFFHTQHHPIPLDSDKLPSSPSLPPPSSSSLLLPSSPSVMFGREAQLNSTTLWIQFAEQYPNNQRGTIEGEREGEGEGEREGEGENSGEKEWEGFIPPKWLWEKGVEWGVKGMMGGWVGGLVSNLDYLLFLNGVAGRRTGDPDAHPILPWVCDFTTQTPTPNRNLKYSKFRLAKGDNQLDYTYSNASPPHHVTEPLTDLTYYIYLARNTPLSVLKTYVRSNFRPDEYPLNMRKMYETTPHECIPEFFTDPSIFSPSSCPSPPPLPPISLPSWASSPVDFVKKHREMLESEEVSSQLHHWIDLMFGFKLTGEAAVEAKNVPLLSSNKSEREWCGYVRLFSSPHPPTIFQEEEEEEKKEEKGEKEDKKGKERKEGEGEQEKKGEEEEGDYFLPLKEIEEEDIVLALAQIPLPIAQMIHHCSLSLSSFLRSSSSMPLPEAIEKNGRVIEQKAEFSTKKELALSLVSLLSPSALSPILSSLKERREKGGERKEDQESGKQEEERGGQKGEKKLNKIPGFGKRMDGGKEEKWERKGEESQGGEGWNEKKGGGRKEEEEGLERVLGVISYTPLRRLLLLLLGDGVDGCDGSGGLSMWEIFCCILHSQQREVSFPLSLSSSSSSSPLCSSSLFLSKIFPSSLSPFPSLSCIPSYPPTHLSRRERKLVREIENCFPPYFADLYAFFFIFYSISSYEQKALFASKFLPKLISSVSADAVSLFIVPLVKEILEFEDGKHSLHLMGVVRDLQHFIGVDTFSTEIFPFLVKLYEKTSFYDLQNYLLGVPSVQFMWDVGGLGTTIRRILPHLIDGLKDPAFQSSAKASLVIMLPLIGPLIALKHLVLPLLKSLWRPHSPALLSCLEGMAIHFTEPLLTQVYIPTLLENISKASELTSTKQFHVLLSSLILLESSIDILTSSEIIKHVLVDHYRIFSSILSPSNHILIFFQLLALVIKMGREIGGAMSRKYLLPIVSQYFSYFEYFYDPLTGKEKKSAVFSPAPTLPLSPLVNKELFDMEKGGRLWLFAAFGERENFSEDFLNRLSISLRGEHGNGEKGNSGLTTICSPEFASLLFREFDQIVGRDAMETEISNFEEIVLILNAHFPNSVILFRQLEERDEEGMEGDEEGDEGISEGNETEDEELLELERVGEQEVGDESVKFHIVLERKLKNAQKRLLQASKGTGGGGSEDRRIEGEKEGEKEGGKERGPPLHSSQMPHSTNGGEGGVGEGVEREGHWIQKFSQSSEMNWEKLFTLKVAENRPITHITHKNENQLLAGTRNGICKFFNLGSEEQPHHHLKLSSQRITSLNFLGGNYVEAAIVSDPHTVHIWDYNQNTLLKSYYPSFHHQKERGGLREGLSRGGGGGEMLVSGCYPLSPHHEGFLVALRRGEGEGGRGKEASVIRNGIHDYEALSFLGSSPRIVLVDPLSQNGPSSVWVVPSSVIGQEIKQFYSLPGTPYFILGGSNGRAALLDIRSGGIVSHWVVDPQGSPIRSISTASSFSMPSPSSSFQFLTLAGRTTKLWSVQGGTVISPQKEFKIPEVSSHFSQSEPTLRGAFTEFITTGNVPPATTPFPSALSQPPFGLLSNSEHSLFVLSRSYFASSSLLSQKNTIEMDPQPYPFIDGVMSGTHLPCTGLTILGTFSGSLSVFQ